MSAKVRVVDAASIERIQPTALGGYEGASKVSRELAMYSPPLRSADADLLPAKMTLDARSRDLVRNDGLSTGAIETHKDTVVGSQFMLNSKPNYKILGLDETWAVEFQEEVESMFTLYAESPRAWIDASGHETLTEQVRLVVGLSVFAGEVLSVAEWLDKDYLRPYATAMQMIDTDRLSNPYETSDTDRLRGGVKLDSHGRPVAYNIRVSHPNDFWQQGNYSWKEIQAYTRFGRQQVIHIYQRMRPEQTRGVASIVAALKKMRMSSKYSDVVLQNAVLNASYAATIESELPRDAVLDQIGARNTGDITNSLEYAQQYLNKIAEYAGYSKNLHIDNVKIPTLFPGTKLKLQQPGSELGGIGENFEASLHRYIAAALGVSYEQYSRDYSRVNYAGAKASANEVYKHQMAKKKYFADRYATAVFALWLEEAIARKDITSMPKNAPSFYERLNKEAYTACTWIGSSRGQIDELKETQAAALRMNSNISTLSEECARNGQDWREVLRQRARETKFAENLGLTLSSTAATKPGSNQVQNAMKNKGNQQQKGNNQNA